MVRTLYQNADIDLLDNPLSAVKLQYLSISLKSLPIIAEKSEKESLIYCYRLIKNIFETK
jgi:hypothetical protein